MSSQGRARRACANHRERDTARVPSRRLMCIRTQLGRTRVRIAELRNPAGQTSTHADSPASPARTWDPGRLGRAYVGSERATAPPHLCAATRWGRLLRGLPNDRVLGHARIWHKFVQRGIARTIHRLLLNPQRVIHHDRPSLELSPIAQLSFIEFRIRPMVWISDPTENISNSSITKWSDGRHDVTNGRWKSKKDWTKLMPAALDRRVRDARLKSIGD